MPSPTLRALPCLRFATRGELTRSSPSYSTHNYPQPHPTIRCAWFTLVNPNRPNDQDNLFYSLTLRNFKYLHHRAYDDEIKVVKRRAECSRVTE